LPRLVVMLVIVAAGFSSRADAEVYPARIVRHFNEAGPFV